ncbi:MAG: hypothetical protein FWD17_08230 [Polyangiaceae bacterium]|nr:hypothetical protein [Polyangiaceae bacterium]
MTRAAVLALLALGLGWLLTAATDEGNVRWGERAGRTVPLAPLCAAIGVWGALAPVRARGEARALEALGRTRGQVGAAAVSGGAAVAVAAAAVVAGLGTVSLAGFYPTVTHARAWRWEGDAFVDRLHAVRVGADAMPQLLPQADDQAASLPTAIPPHGRAAAALVTALTGVALSMLLAQGLLSPSRRARSVRRRFALSALPGGAPVAATGAVVATTIVLFQAAAARLLPSLVAVVPAAALILFALRRYWAAP